MESFWNRLPDIGCQVHVQYSIRDEVAVDLADDGLLEGDSVILCPLLYHVLLAGTRPLLLRGVPWQSSSAQGTLCFVSQSTWS